MRRLLLPLYPSLSCSSACVQFLDFDSPAILITCKLYSCDIHHYHTIFRFRAIVKRLQIYRLEAINMSTASTETNPALCSEEGLSEVSVHTRAYARL